MLTAVRRRALGYKGQPSFLYARQQFAFCAQLHQQSVLRTRSSVGWCIKLPLEKGQQ